MATKTLTKAELDSALELKLSGTELGVTIAQVQMDEDGRGNVHPIVLKNIRKLMHVAERMELASEIAKKKFSEFAAFLDGYCDEPYQPDGTFDESLLR